jgi:hypothetical protein
MQALEHEYSSVIDALEKMASDFIKIQTKLEEGSSIPNPAESSPCLKKNLAPIYDGTSELEMVTIL